MSEIAMSRDQYRVAYEDDADNVRGKPFTLPAGDANHSDVITGVSSPSTSHLAPKLGQTIRDAEREMLAENAALKATLSRVEALAEEWHWKDPVWLGLGPTGRCDSGQPLLDLLALDKRRGGGVMAFSGHLAFVMFVGAARADADPAQRDRLKAEIPPLLEEYGGSPETVLRQVVEIMGPQWRPTGEWATWIDGLTKRERRQVMNPSEKSAEWYPYVPAIVPPPGETVRETLEELEMSQSKLAARTGLTLKHVNQIVQGNASITPATALALERATSVPASFWNALEADYQDHKVRAEEVES